MSLTWHPPLAVGPPGDALDHIHVRVWVRVEAEPWHVVREAHLHLVRPLDRGGSSFSSVDLSRSPLRPSPGRVEPEGFRERALAEYQAWLRGWRPRLWRAPELGMVSEIGDTEAGFRRRVLRLLQPELEREIERARSAPPSRLPWRRRRAERERQLAREEMAARLAGLAASLETWEAPSGESAVRSAEAGLLAIPPGLRIPPPGQGFHRSFEEREDHG